MAAEPEGSSPETSKPTNEHYAGPLQKFRSKLILPWYFEAVASKKFSYQNFKGISCLTLKVTVEWAVQLVRIPEITGSKPLS